MIWSFFILLGLIYSIVSIVLSNSLLISKWGYAFDVCILPFITTKALNLDFRNNLYLSGNKNYYTYDYQPFYFSLSLFLSHFLSLFFFLFPSLTLFFFLALFFILSPSFFFILFSEILSPSYFFILFSEIC